MYSVIGMFPFSPAETSIITKGLLNSEQANLISDYNEFTSIFWLS